MDEIQEDNMKNQLQEVITVRTVIEPDVQGLWDATAKLYDLLRETLTADLKCVWNIRIERALGRLDDIEDILECAGARARDPEEVY